jgi:hypothetical protein
MWCMDYGLGTLTFDLCDLTFGNGTWDPGPLGHGTWDPKPWSLDIEV